MWEGAAKKILGTGVWFMILCNLYLSGNKTELRTSLRLPREDGNSFPSLVPLLKSVWLFVQQAPESRSCSLRDRPELFEPESVGSVLPQIWSCQPSSPRSLHPWPALLAAAVFLTPLSDVPRCSSVGCEGSWALCHSPLFCSITQRTFTLCLPFWLLAVH